MKVLVTGAAGNLGKKLCRHLEARHKLVQVDIDPHGDPQIVQADLSVWDSSWVELFAGVDSVVHLAADPSAAQSWESVVRPNLDGLNNVYLAAAQQKVRRFIFGSSNHVMGGYKDSGDNCRITVDLPPKPGTRYMRGETEFNSTPYAGAKLFGERLGKSISDVYGISVIAVRIGWVFPGDNRPEDLPPDRGQWFEEMWLSNRDFCRLMECCITAELKQPFVIVNGMSQNSGMRWDLARTRELVGFEPLDRK